MSKPYPPIEVIRAAPAGGLRHVSEYLALALGGALPVSAVTAPGPIPPTLPAHPGIAKCHGAGMACCGVCVRALAHAAAGQQWCESDIVDGACTLYASLERFGALVVK